MSRRTRGFHWLIVLLLIAIGYFTRGTATNTPSRSSGSDFATPVAERSGKTPERVPLQTSKPIVEPTPQVVAPAAYRKNDQLHLRVVGVHDGDTLTGLDETKTQFKVRLDAVDAPELGQPFGQEAKKTLSEKVFGKEVTVIRKTTDRYGRTVGHVLIDGRDVNLEMLEAGMAWHYVKYDKNARLSRAEEDARAAKNGLWRDRDPVPPWDWRKTKREKK